MTNQIFPERALIFCKHHSASFCSWSSRIPIFVALVWHPATHREINLSGNFYILENSVQDVSVQEDFAKVRAFTVCLHIFFLFSGKLCTGSCTVTVFLLSAEFCLNSGCKNTMSDWN